MIGQYRLFTCATRVKKSQTFVKVITNNNNKTPTKIFHIETNSLYQAEINAI